MFLMAYPPDGWSSQDGRVLFDAERQAERFASNARLAFSLTIATLMLLLSIMVGRWNDWVAVIAVVNIAISALGAFRGVPRRVGASHDRAAHVTRRRRAGRAVGRPAPRVARLRTGG